MLPLVQGRDRGRPWWGFVLLAASVPTGVLLWHHGRRLTARGEPPLLDPALPRVRAFRAGLAASALFFGAIGAFFLMLSLYLQWGTGRSDPETGLVVLPYAIGSILTSGIGVRYAERAGRPALLVCGTLAPGPRAGAVAARRTGGGDALVRGVGGAAVRRRTEARAERAVAGERDPGRGAGPGRGRGGGGVLTTVDQMGNALGVAALGALFFAEWDSAHGQGAAPLAAYGQALGAVSPWRTACDRAAAALMLAPPRTAEPA
ncbi:hypothetical protein [Streptomyces sp. NPDC057702]|uniref:hypothetical protein n=1 Tax=unclassified Streptomyces TaxID=2593676 RepID=UPI0036A56EE4